MFSKTAQVNSKQIETIIGQSVKVEGDFICQGSIIVEGELKGSVKTSDFLKVGVKSLILADVEASEALVAGEIKGDIKVSGYLELTSTAKILGNIQAGSISVAKGAMLSGQILVSGQEKANKIIKKAKEEKEEIIVE